MDETVKKRLVGAIVLVTLAVIFVPFLLEEKESPSQSAVELEEKIPVRPTQKFRSGLVPDEKTATQEVIRAESQEAEFNISERLDLSEYKPPAVTEERSGASTKPVEEQWREEKKAEKASTPTTAPKPEKKRVVTETAKVQSTPDKGWIIQAGAFAKKSGADKTHKILVESGMNPYVQEIRVDEKRLYLVRIGPFSSKSKAQQHLKKVEKKTGHKGMVKNLK
ncbi:MAG TPA: hypothetical protein DDW45_00330 [Gammaproteobacteria bacterium]|nr:hypothetical protein [Gammaproteobacteria bacterium]